MRPLNKMRQLTFFRKQTLYIVMALLVSVSGCSSKGTKVPVVDKTSSYHHQVKVRTVQDNLVGKTSSTVRHGNTDTSLSGRYVVQHGETLYSLAFRSGRDWRELAQANNIAAPYTIYPGQTLNLSGNGSKITPTVSTVTPTQTTKVTSTNTRQSSSGKVTTTVTTTKPVVSTANTTTPQPTQAVVGGWTWPAMGTVVNTFSTAGAINKGIDIAGKEGDPIVAASAGTVVYAGNNLRGYGELLIIKHNDSYVSAYAHNRRLLVKEGQKVTTGQKIAEMGSTAADRVKLHFEIRRNGQPVNPIQYLPKK